MSLQGRVLGAKPGGASSGGAPSGAAGGELAGTYPNPTVADGVIDDANIVAGGLTNAAIATAAAIAQSKVSGLTSALAAKAPAASPTFTGTVDASGATVTLPSGLVLPASVVIPSTAVATTQAASDNSTKVATTAYADAADALKLAKASNLSDVANAGTARTNLGLGAAALGGATAFAPQWTNMCFPYPPQVANSGNITGANIMVACRVMVPKSGTLTDITVFVGTTSGNVDLGVYDCGDTTPAVYTRLYSTGSVACVGNNTWQTVSGSTGVSVVQGQHIVLAVAADNSTTTFARGAGMVNTAQCQLPTGFLPAGGGNLPKVYWTKTASFPLPSSVSEANAAQVGNCPCIIARIV